MLLLCAPMGAAGQNIALAIAIVSLLSSEFQQSTLLDSYKQFRKSALWFPSVSFLLLLIWTSVASVLNPENPASRLVEYLAGYLPMVFLPPLIASSFSNLTNQQKEKIYALFVWVVVIVAIICVSQSIIGWKRSGFDLVITEKRARGLYTHPLSLAYVIILILPFALQQIKEQPKRLCSWLLLISTILIVWTTRSRVIQMASLAAIGFYILYYSRGIKRGLLIGFAVISLLTISFTKNSVSDNFIQTLQGKADRHALDYPDDRLAFWDAHQTLIKKRPLLGHGVHLPNSVIEQAYQDIGLENFSKKYSAHNMYLQTTVDGGVVGLVLFLSWFFGLLVVFKKHWPQPWAVSITLSIAIFGLAILTQNAIQDNEVRYCLTLMLGFGFAKLKEAKQLATNSDIH